MTEKLNNLQTEISDFEQSVSTMTSKCTMLEKKNQETWEDAERKHREEIGLLRQHNQSLKDELEKHLSMTK